MTQHTVVFKTLTSLVNYTKKYQFELILFIDSLATKVTIIENSAFGILNKSFSFNVELLTDILQKRNKIYLRDASGMLNLESIDVPYEISNEMDGDDNPKQLKEIQSANIHKQTEAYFFVSLDKISEPIQKLDNVVLYCEKRQNKYYYWIYTVAREKIEFLGVSDDYLSKKPVFGVVNMVTWGRTSTGQKKQTLVVDFKSVKTVSFINNLKKPM